ncbi:MAG: NAD-dependent epimerase/dehydratase family protein, partial [Nitrospinota bacterium]|nr:NAD-dependent epimerase/dehydratase family protein [Nitrospinota bacterium]
MKVLVTGATGFVGNKVVKALHEIGHQSVVLTRNIQKAQVRLPYSCQI